MTALKETYYMKFNDELSRESFRQKVISHEYYIAHYTYERKDTDGLTQYMLCVDMGNYLPNSKTPVTGEHIPVPLYETEEEENA